MTVATVTLIRLETSCGEMCDRFSRPLLEQMGSGRYDRCSVLALPDSLQEWELAHRTAAKRVWRALKRGYYVTQYRREQWADHIHAINTSMPERQGRPMSAGYLTHQEYGPLPDYECDRHLIRTWGVFSQARDLVGYMHLYRVGDLVLVSQILGHGDHLKDEIMWLLFAIGMSYEIGNPGYVVYNRHDSGTEGLRWFKERLGFEEREVEWLP